MRRYAFYLAIALLAFGIGSFFSIKFYWKAEEKTIYKEETSISTENQPKENFSRGFGTGFGERRLNEPVYVPKLHKATCNNKNLLPLWNELRKDKVFRERENEFYQTGDCLELIEVDRIDLNNNGQKEFIVWGRYTFSGATGNCVIWIYEKRDGKYKQLLQSYAYKNGNEEEWFEVKKIKSKGYNNILLKLHYSGYETVYRFYKFNGKNYAEDKCLYYDYFLNEKKPMIMTCKEHSEQVEKESRENQ
jgi:hypothetical protein